jgi:hypothetical protein
MKPVFELVKSQGQVSFVINLHDKGFISCAKEERCKYLEDMNVSFGHDITMTAALAKCSYLLGQLNKFEDPSNNFQAEAELIKEKPELVQEWLLASLETSLRGEMTNYQEYKRDEDLKEPSFIELYLEEF